MLREQTKLCAEAYSTSDVPPIPANQVPHCLIRNLTLAESLPHERILPTPLSWGGEEDEAMMSMTSKRELLTTVSPRYVTATGVDKARILDECVATTGYHRKYALALLNDPPIPRSRAVKRPRAKTYPPAVQRALVRLWEIAGRICRKRLVPDLPDLLDALERHGELTLDPPTRALLLTLSPATADRLLAPTRRATVARGRTTTKPGSLLKHQIPIRTFADWDDERAGFLEIDLVGHGGESTSGEYLHSLVLTDIRTQWTECIALRNRGEQAVSTAIAHARTLLPVPLLGLDSDNGGEFINHHLCALLRARTDHLHALSPVQEE